MFEQIAVNCGSFNGVNTDQAGSKLSQCGIARQGDAEEGDAKSIRFISRSINDMVRNVYSSN